LWNAGLGKQIVDHRGGGGFVRRDRTATTFLQLLAVIGPVEVRAQRTGITVRGNGEVAYDN